MSLASSLTSLTTLHLLEKAHPWILSTKYSLEALEGVLIALVLSSHILIPSSGHTTPEVLSVVHTELVRVEILTLLRHVLK